MRNSSRRRWVAAVAMTTTLMVVGCGSNSTSESVSQAGTAQPEPASQAAVPERLRTVIASTLKVNESAVTPDAAFATDLGADELGLVELVMAYEREFKVDISREDAETFRQVRDVVAYLQRHNAL